MPPSSTPFERVFVPFPERSRCALTIWLAQHVVAGAAISISQLTVYLMLCGFLLIIASALWSLPGRCPPIAVLPDGTWALPDAALSDLQILPGTQFTQWWVLLKLGRSDGVRRSLRIWHDVFAPGDWRQLIIRLREH